MEDAEAPQQLDKGGVVDGCCAIEFDHPQIPHILLTSSGHAQ